MVFSLVPFLRCARHRRRRVRFARALCRRLFPPIVGGPARLGARRAHTGVTAFLAAPILAFLAVVVSTVAKTGFLVTV